MYSTADFKKNLKILIDNDPYVVVDFQHVKPGKGNQFTRTKLKNMITGSNLERTFKSGEKFAVPDVRTRDMSFLYKDESGYNFMDKETYEQMSIAGDDIGENVNYLLENLDVTVLFFNNKPIGVDVPNAVNLTVVETDPGFKGNTVTNVFKPAKMQTGAVIQVPLHINEGDVVRVDTRTGDYVSRVNE
ncbi:MAG: elongation factor P [Bdellovibrionales bacterium CG10_big_fil_rev_8_21_14_0_10_45_34]|nr:MAG: elongation factor P [Bdellovibrionales bacterium CG10_big_fil_rev_8_21_14_0_10_45_34]